jgi:hypothetical protein
VVAVSQQTDLEMREKVYFYFLDLTVLISYLLCSKLSHTNFRLSVFRDLKEKRGVVP